MLEKAIALINEQLEPYKKGQAERRAGRLMIKLCESNPQAAEFIAQDITKKQMSLAECTDKVRQAAKKQAQENKCNECEFDDEDYLEIICEFYGIGGELQPITTVPKPAAHPQKPISIFDYL